MAYGNSVSISTRALPKTRNYRYDVSVGRKSNHGFRNTEHEARQAAQEDARVLAFLVRLEYEERDHDDNT